MREWNKMKLWLSMICVFVQCAHSQCQQSQSLVVIFMKPIIIENQSTYNYLLGIGEGYVSWGLPGGEHLVLTSPSIFGEVCLTNPLVILTCVQTSIFINKAQKQCGSSRPWVCPWSQILIGYKLRNSKEKILYLDQDLPHAGFENLDAVSLKYQLRLPR